MSRERARQIDRNAKSRMHAAAKAAGRRQLSLILPAEDLAVIDEVKAARKFSNRADAISFVLTALRDEPRLREELGLVTR